MDKHKAEEYARELSREDGRIYSVYRISPSKYTVIWPRQPVPAGFRLISYFEGGYCKFENRE